jgi:hypothetical protein
MVRFLLVVLCGAVPWSACFAQTDGANPSPTPRTASLCDLKLNPASYDGQWITVRGRVSMEFEDFTLYDQDCNAPNLPGIWLTFGGDQDEMTAYCCAGGTRKKGVDIEVDGQRVPLVRDEALREFLRVLQAQRLRRPDGHECEGNECYLYRPVSATITGLFLAGQDGAESPFPGYGHLGCCHLLVIRQAANVSAERTEVPAGGQFACATETWNVSSPIAFDLSNLLACATSHDEACDNDRRTAFMRIAEHWNDRIDAGGRHRARYVKANGDSIDSWVSANLLTSYSTVTKESSVPARLLVTREGCVPFAGKPWNPSSVPFSCQNYAISWRDDDASAQQVDELLAKDKFDSAGARIAEASKAILSDGDRSWRLKDAKSAAWHAFHEQTQKWGVVTDAALRLDDCQDAGLTDLKSRIMGCNWYSSDGMQAFAVSLMKYPKSTKADPVGRHIPWVVTDISATICR